MTTGEATIEARSHRGAQSTILYCSWFCPYAQRAWIALEEKGVEYQYVEINPYEMGERPGTYTKIALSIEEKRRKYPDFVATSPRGLVPGIRRTQESAQYSVWESAVCMEYIDEAYEGSPLMPSDPAQRAHVRAWCLHANERVIPHFYKMLLSPAGSGGREKAYEDFLAGLRTWQAAMQPDGPFFMGSVFTLADVNLAPWWQRMLSVLKHYRNMEVPQHGFKRLHRWFAAVRARPAFARTVVDQQRLIANYSGYADNTATSEVAKKFAARASSTTAGQARL